MSHILLIITESLNNSFNLYKNSHIILTILCFMNEFHEKVWEKLLISDWNILQRILHVFFMRINNNIKINFKKGGGTNIMFKKQKTKKQTCLVITLFVFIKKARCYFPVFFHYKIFYHTSLKYHAPFISTYKNFSKQWIST